MKTRGLLLSIFVVAFAVAANAAPLPAQQLPVGHGYSARLISPRPGDILLPGQQVRVQWQAALPHVDMTWCELELYLSLDGGRTYPIRLTPQLDPRIGYFDWTVPNTPTGAAVLDIRFGCEGYYPESASVQSRSMFVIARSVKAAPEVAIVSVTPAEASPKDNVQVSWTSSVEGVDHFEVQISADGGAHFYKVGDTKDQHFTWQVPEDFAGHATFRVIAQSAGAAHVDSLITAEPQVIVRASSR
jgi:hypothetical protein